MTDIQALNAILVQLGGTTAYKYNIQAYNAWSVLQGGTGTYTRDIDALNAIDVLNGGSGGHRYNINALNSIDVAAGGTGGHTRDISALTSLATLLNHFVPSDIEGGLLWYKSTDITNVSGKASVLTELFGGVNHVVQGTDSRRPTVISGLNGKQALLFNGLTQRMVGTSNVVQAQPFTVYLVVKHLAYKNNSAFTGTGAPLQALPYILTDRYCIYSGSFTTGLPIDLNNPLAFCSTVNGANSKIKKNESETSKYNSGSNALNNKIVIGNQTDADTACLNFEFYEYILYSGVHDDATKTKFYNYFNSEYNYTFSSANRFDGIMDNSVIYSNETGYDKRNSFGEYNFTTENTTMSIVGADESTGKLHIFENDVFKSSVTVNGLSQAVALSDGTKKVTIVNDFNIAPTGTIKGSFIKDIRIADYLKIAIGTVVDKIVLFGDSISVGGGATNPVTDGFGRLFKIENSVPVAHLGWGYATVANIASDSSKITTQISYLQTMFSNVTGRKIVIMQPGINDLMLNSLPSATFKTYYGNLIDAIHLSDNEIEVYCLGLIYHSGEGAGEAAYRTAISDLCSTRAWSTYINGLPICTYPGDFADTVHPNTAGHKKIKDALYSVIFP